MQNTNVATIVTDTENESTTITGYEAELIKLQAERVGKTPEEFVLSFFEVRCIAPRTAAGGCRRLTSRRASSFCR